MYTPYSGDTGMLLHIEGKLVIAKSKLSRFSYNLALSLPPVPIFNRISKYEAEVDGSVVSLISNSPGHMESTHEWNSSLLIDKTLSIYLNVELQKSNLK
jgi:hypothetical protein